MELWFDLTEQNRKLIFEQTSIRAGLPAAAIEKDWWVVYTLHTLFSMPVGQHLVFKGGTSLSKCFNLIERFSEDIDLVIDRRFLGFEGPLSKKQVKKLRRASCTYISTAFKEALKAWLHERGVPGVTVVIDAIQNPDEDPVVVALEYTSIVEAAPYLRPRVLIEIGARSLKEPYAFMPINTLVSQHFANTPFATPAFKVPAVLPRRTFLEKAFLLHEEFLKPVEKIRIDRLSRHLYDLEKIMDTPHGQEALHDHDLYQAVIEHRATFNTVRGISYRAHQPGQINFIPPPNIMLAWERDYAAMMESMIYGPKLSFDKLIERLKDLQGRFRKIQGA